MTATPKPAYPPLELDAFDARLDQRAAERGIPTLKSPQSRVAAPVAEPVPPTGARATLPAVTSGQGAETGDDEKEVEGAVSRPNRRPRVTKTDRAMATVEDALPTPRARMVPLNVELPDYAWVELKSRAAQNFSSVRYLILKMLAKDGIHIAEADLIEDGRRLRQGKG